jgi:tetratricopeptide (TPR) repeat protein
MTVLSHMADCQLFGLNPWGHHLSSVLLHALNAVLVFALLKQMTGATWQSLLVAALFAVHPLRVESVAWVAERKDVLSGFFGLLALIAYARYAQTAVISDQWSVISNQPSGPRTTGQGLPQRNYRLLITDHRLLFYLLSLFFLALGLMSKPMLVTWPFVMLLLDFWPLRRLELSTLLRLVREKIPLFGLVALGSVATFVVQQQTGALAVGYLPLGERVGNALISYGRYLGKLFWPTDLAVVYPHPGHSPLAEVLLAGGVILGISVLFWVGRRRFPFLLMGWLWYCGTLMPVSQLVQTGSHAMADRYTYLPALGVLILATWGIYEITRGWRFQALALSVAGAGVIFACLALTRQQVGYWKDSETLFRHALEVTKNNCLAHNNLGNALLEKGKTDSAIDQYQAALRLVPGFANAHYGLGCALARRGHIDGAIQEYQEALRLKPDCPEIHFGLGNAISTKGRIDEAIGQLQCALQLKPDYAEAHYGLGVAFAVKGQMEEAISQFREAIRVLPAYPEALSSVADALNAQGRYMEAIQSYRASLKARPDQAAVLNNLAWLLASCPDAAIRNGPEAVRLATRACELTSYAKPLLIGTLAAAQAEAGDFQAAIATGERAAALADTLRLEEVAAKNRELIQLYRQGQAFHEKR